MTTTVAGFRRDQVARFEKVRDSLNDLNDDDLNSVQRAVIRLSRDSLDDHEWGDPVVQAFVALSDVVVCEANHRLATIWNMEGEMRGGHKVLVINDLEEVGTFQAVCWPRWDDSSEDHFECWTGPRRTTAREAFEDGRRHNPGFDPEDHITGLEGEE